MYKNKTFLKGLISGLIIFTLCDTIITAGVGIYKRVVLNVVTSEQKLDEIKYIIDKYYVEDTTPDQLNEGMYQGVVASLKDPYSYYMDKSVFEQFLQDTNGNYVGIGIMVTLTEDKNLSIVNIFKDSPADKAGLLPKDKILKINDTPIDSKDYSDAISMIKGKEGTNVKLTVFRESEDKTFDVLVKRKSIDVPTVSHKILEDNIGYIKISQFDGVTFDQFKQAFYDIEKQGAKGLVIDLRDNPGGLLNIVVKITDLLVPKGVITYVEDKYGEKNYEYSDENSYNKPLTILVNENSASASEVLSGAVKDLGVGKLVGETTYGKGVVQNIYKLTDGSGVKVTIAKYYTPSGVCIDGTGIEPDYFVELEKGAEYNSEEDTQLKKAIEVINNW